MAVFNIKVVSDNVCPFCYLGKARLEKAIAMYKKVIPGGTDDTFRISWSAFYLDPEGSKEGIPVREKMAQKFGAARYEAMNQRLCQLGKADGICFTSDSKVGNTRDSHRVVQFAKAKGDNDVENRVVSELMKAYFEEGGDITSHTMLASAAERAGLDREEVEECLAGDSYGDEVDRQAQEAQDKGIRGVPNFTINDSYHVSGAQDVSAFLEALCQAKGIIPEGL